MTVVRIETWDFKADVPTASIKEMCDRYLALKKELPFILSFTGGLSWEMFEDSRQRVVFVIEFENQDDLNRYIDDPTHVALEMNMGSDAVTEGVRNNQYTNGFWG
ncbi:hypothetical protein ASPCAL01867 [Aspergillus calidoustus]|uniref:Stress-response A/B barrel domain-containing protein n=1 Tax=Aspergillus calidoustus TaxID=454130 RepID=A0A0U5GIW8_ASPCI|nr:hypothetical protein ASPCAL01867 [Aspergillus calidoustus]